MGWFEASIALIVGVIALAVIVPVGNALLPSMKESMGGTIVTMVSAMFVVILVVMFILYVRQSQEPDTFLSGGGEQF